MIASLFVSAVAIFLGSFVAASPQRAAEIWGSEKLYKLSPEKKISFVRWYRLFGILLCLAGVLSVVDCVFFARN